MNAYIHMIIFITTVTSPFFFVFEVQAIDSKKDIQSTCEFYDSFTLPKGCTADYSPYTSTYGKKYCEKFKSLKEESRSSNELKEWITNTSKCLQEMLKDNRNRITPNLNFPNCDQLKEFAFDSHPVCYKQYGFCTLNETDKNMIMSQIEWQDIEKDLRRSLIQGLNVFTSCWKSATPSRRDSFARVFESTRGARPEEREMAAKIFKMAPTDQSESSSFFQNMFAKLTFKDNKNMSSEMAVKFAKILDRDTSLSPSYFEMGETRKTYRAKMEDINPEAAKNFVEKTSLEQIKNATDLAKTLCVSYKTCQK